MTDNTERPRVWDMEMKRDNVSEYFVAIVREYFRPLIHPIKTVEECSQAVQGAAKWVKKVYKKVMWKK